MRFLLSCRTVLGVDRRGDGDCLQLALMCDDDENILPTPRYNMRQYISVYLKALLSAPVASLCIFDQCRLRLTTQWFEIRKWPT